MTANNPHESVNYIPFLTEEMESTLRRLAWKDEDFRDALLADPKGIIQQVFPHCFPEGKLPDDLTINVVEQDPFTRHIVFPAFADEEPTLEIPEEDQLDLIINLGDLGMARDSYDARMRAQSTGERKRSFLEADAKRMQAKENENVKMMGDGKEGTNEPLPKKEVTIPTKEEYEKALPQIVRDKQLLETLRTHPKEGTQLIFQKYFPNHKLPEGFEFKLHQNTEKQWTIVMSLSRDDSGIPHHEGIDTINKEIPGIKTKGGECTDHLGCTHRGC